MRWKNKLKLLLRGRLAHLMSNIPFLWMPARRRLSLADCDLQPLVILQNAKLSIPQFPSNYRNIYERMVPKNYPCYAFEIPARKGYRLLSATVRMPESFVMTSAGKIIDESLPSRHCLDSMGLLREFFRPKFLHQHSSPAFMLGMPYQKNYHLWLHYALPRLAVLSDMTVDEDSEVTVVVSNAVPDFVRDTLNSYQRLFRKVLIEYLPAGNHKFPIVYLMQPMSVKDLPNPMAVEWLRKTFLNDVGPPMSKRRLYLTRRGALERDIINESFLTDFLELKGFEIIDGGKISFDEQVAAFRDAEIVIGPHGASFSNLSFCSPNTLVIEIIGGSHFMPCFTFLAAQLDLIYIPISAATVGAHMAINDENIAEISFALKGFDNSI